MYFLLTGCQNPTILRIIYFIKLLIDLVFMVIPIALIVMLLFDFTKMVIASSIEKQREKLKLALKRIIMAVFIFFVPSIVNIANNLLDDLGVDYAKCLSDAIPEKINQYQSIEEQEEKQKEQEKKQNEEQKILQYKKETEKYLSSKVQEAKEAQQKEKETTNTTNNTNNQVFDSPNLLQFDSKWKNEKLCKNNGTFQNAGCGYVSLTIVINSINNTKLTPPELKKDICNLTNEDGSAINDDTLVNTNLLSKYNLKAQIIKKRSDNFDETKLKQIVKESLEKGHPVIILIPGHYVAATKISNNKVTYYNPGSQQDVPSGSYTLDELYSKTKNYKNRCTNNGNCGWKYIISYSKK